MGGGVIQRLNYDLEYENVLAVRSKPGGKVKLGLNTNARTKIIGCMRVKEQIESDMMKIYDEATSEEFFNFVEHKTSYAAEVGQTDDMVMTLVMFAFFSTTAMFAELSKVNFSEKFLEARIAELEGNLCPLPVMDDGIDGVESDDYSAPKSANYNVLYDTQYNTDEDLSGL